MIDESETLITAHSAQDRIITVEDLALNVKPYVVKEGKSLECVLIIYYSEG